MAITTLTQGATTVNLNNSASGTYIVRDGWVRQRAQQNEDGEYQDVYEAMTCGIAAASADNLAYYVDAVDVMLDNAQGYISTHQLNDPVWLNVQMTGESTAARSLVKGGLFVAGTDFFSPPATPDSHVPRYNLSVTRHYAWEARDEVTQSYTGAAGNVFGGKFTLTSAVAGNLPGRVSRLTVSGSTGSQAVDELWVGFRSGKYGDFANFTPLWEMEDGAFFNDTGTAADATAHGGIRVQHIYVTTNRVNICNVQLDDVTANYSDHTGKFLVLCRAKITTDREYTLEMFYGAAGAINTGPRVKIDGTFWKFYPMGYITIPPGRRLQYNDTYFQDYAIGFYSTADATGTGNLYIDCLVLVPSSEGVCHVSSVNVQYAAGIGYPCVVECSPEDTFTGLAQAEAVPTGTTWHYVPIDAPDFFVPTGTTGMVLAGHNTTSGSALTDAVDLSIRYYPRYLSLRGGG
jgi:hypothetical protein